VLDWDGYTERGTLEAPSQLASSVRHVLVNGMPTLRDGAPTGHSAGAVIRR